MKEPSRAILETIARATEGAAHAWARAELRALDRLDADEAAWRAERKRAPKKSARRAKPKQPRARNATRDAPSHRVADWRKVLGFPPKAAPTAHDIEAAYRALARQHHPDVGGDTTMMQAINVARDEALGDYLRRAS